MSSIARSVPAKRFRTRGAKRPEQHSLLLSPEAQAPYPRVLESSRLIAVAGLNDRCYRFSGNARFARYDRPETFDDLAPAETIECVPYG